MTKKIKRNTQNEKGMNEGMKEWFGRDRSPRHLPIRTLPANLNSPVSHTSPVTAALSPSQANLCISTRGGSALETTTI